MRTHNLKIKIIFTANLLQSVEIPGKYIRNSSFDFF